MTLDAGTRIGPYDIVAPLGAGGMGEVYRARDARLKRDIALKILPPSVGDNPDSLVRFEREAQALAALNHPNIAAIYGFEEKAGDDGARVRALVLELVDGETLAERIARGPLPAADALAIAKQIASALEAAHEQGIVHRDLKPANIKITPDGVVKVLDFGLAKLASGDNSSIDRMQTLAAAMSPTMTSPALVTGAGTLLGTAAYMSPEQARGKAADKRADIWSFGVVLYEMLTGSRAFGGDTVTETAGAVIHKELDWHTLPPDLPASIGTVLRRCLQKDPLQRLRDMGDVRLALDGAFAVDTPAALPLSSTRSARRWIEVAGAAVVAAAATSAVVWLATRPAAPANRFAMRMSAPINSSILALSPDGRYLAAIAGAPETGQRLWIHSFETGTSRVIEQAGQVRQPPIWSPDGRSIAFVSDNKLQRIDIDGGPPQVICDVFASAFGGGTWMKGNVIVFSEASSGGLKEVSASGGTPVQRTKAPNGADVLPWMLPDGRHFLYTRLTATGTGQMLVGSIGTPPEQQDTTTILTTSRGVAYAPAQDGGPGHVLFMRDRLLLAQAFDPQTLTLSGEPVGVVEPVGNLNVLGSFSVSANGALAYFRASSDTGSLVWVGRDGSTTPIASGLRGLRNPRLSPDGRVLAAVVAGDLWAYDVRGRPPIRLTSGGEYFTPLFTRDGTRVVFEGNEEPRQLFSVPADGSGGAPSRVGPPGHFHPHGWSLDGMEIVASRLPGQPNSGPSTDLVRFATSENAQIQPVVDTPAAEGPASVSPDGRWIAYASDSTGTTEIWVRPFPGPGAPIRVSPSGGSEPVWSKNGRELYYLQGTNMMAVAVDAGAAFNFMPPTRVLDATTLERGTQAPNYDVAADGRFVFVKADAQSNQSVSVILNWQELLRQKPAH